MTVDEISTHGWWYKGTCSKTTALVTTCVYEWWISSDGSTYAWLLENCGPKVTGTGTYNRANARKVCDDFILTGFMNVVDVDVVGEGDTAETASRIQNQGCRIYS